MLLAVCYFPLWFGGEESGGLSQVMSMKAKAQKLAKFRV